MLKQNKAEMNGKILSSYLEISCPSCLLVSQVIKNIKYRLGIALAGRICVTMYPPFFSPKITLLRAKRYCEAVRIGIWICEELFQ